MKLYSDIIRIQLGEDMPTIIISDWQRINEIRGVRRTLCIKEVDISINQVDIGI
jgi:hypothetical protein